MSSMILFGCIRTHQNIVEISIPIAGREAELELEMAQVPSRGGLPQHATHQAVRAEEREPCDRYDEGLGRRVGDHVVEGGGT